MVTEKLAISQTDRTSSATPSAAQLHEKQWLTQDFILGV